MMEQQGNAVGQAEAQSLSESIDRCRKYVDQIRDVLGIESTPVNRAETTPEPKVPRVRASLRDQLDSLRRMEYRLFEVATEVRELSILATGEPDQKVR